MTGQYDSAFLRERAFALAGPMGIGLLLVSLVLPAGADAKSRAPTPAATERRTYTAEESTRLGDEARRVSEARQKLWDRKMKAVSGSICNGC